MIPNAGNSKDPVFDQRVRGRDFLAYFKSHMTGICLLFWFFTISVSVTATAIYLLKKVEQSDVQPTGHTTGKPTANVSGSREGEGSDGFYQDAYANYDVLGFLIDSLYAGDQADSYNRSKQAAPKPVTTKPRIAKPDVIYQQEPDPETATAGKAADEDEYMY